MVSANASAGQPRLIFRLWTGVRAVFGLLILSFVA